MLESTSEARRGIQVIARASAILRSLESFPEGRSLGQIAAETNLPRSTVQRIVAALQNENFIVSHSSGNGLRLGAGIGQLARSMKANTPEMCRELLVELARQTGETSDLSVFRDAQMVFIDQIGSTQRLRTISAIGEAFPVTTTANGRASLAAIDRKLALGIARAECLKKNVPLDEQGFSSLLDAVSQSGLAYDEDEHSEGVSAVGFSFSDWTGELYAISIPVPTARYPKQKHRIENALRTARAETKKLFGDVKI